MKTRIISLSTILLAMFVSAPSWALFIDTDADGIAETDVGAVDIVKGFYAKPSGGQIEFPGTGFDGTLCSTLSGNSLAAETCWAEGLLGLNLTLSDPAKTETVDYFKTYINGDDPSTPNTVDAIALALQSGPGYYIIKNATEYVLLQNLANLDWGVIDLDSDPLKNVLFDCSGTCTVSHVTEWNGTTKVAEPGSLALLGAGLFALGAIRRRKFRI